MLNFIANSANLSLRITGTDNKVVSKTAHLARIQQHNIAGLLVTGGFDYPAGNFYRFQTLNLR
jgi:hypothetical protein